MLDHRWVALLMTGLALYLSAGPSMAIAQEREPDPAKTTQPSPSSSASPDAIVPSEEPEKKERGWWPWDWPGRLKDAVFGSIGDAINDWFKGIVESALSPVFDLFSRTVFTTPDLTSQPRLVSLWKIAIGIADATLILFAVSGGAIVMTNGGLGARLTAKEMLPRLLLGAAAANLSLLVVSQTTRLPTP